MDTDNLIRMLNAITEPHFTTGGHHTMTGDTSRDGLVLAAWYARAALPDTGRGLAERVCDLLRAKEELGKVDQHTIMRGEIAGLSSPDLCNVLNGISWATSLVCDEIRALELVKPKSKRK